MLELQDVSFRAESGHGTKEIISHVSLAIKERFVAFTGPNGGGKSTLAKLICGIYQPSEGKILLDGEDITNLSITDRARRGISYAFQQPVRFKGITVRDLITLASGRKLTLSNTVYFDEGVEVRVFLPAGYVCNAFGACNAERITLQFQVGAHNFEPSLIQMTPANGAQRVFANEDVEFVFNKLIKLDPAFQMVFTDETGHSVVFSYAEEASKIMGRLSVAENKLIVSGSMLPAGHTYNVFFDPELIMDYQGRVARGLPKTYSFTYSEYPCSGNYIYEDMGDECSCFLTSSTCECHCGKEETPDAVMIRLQL